MLESLKWGEEKTSFNVDMASQAMAENTRAAAAAAAAKTRSLFGR